MLRPFLFQLRRSLGYRALVPIAGTCLALAVLGYVGTSWLAHEQGRDRIEKRAELVARTVGYVTETVRDDADFQRIVHALGAEPLVREIVVAAGEPARVIASSRNAFVGQELADIVDGGAAASLRQSLAASRESVRYHPDTRLVEYAMPLTNVRGTVGAEPGAVVVYVDARPVEDQMGAWAAAAGLGFVIAAMLVLIGGTWVVYKLVLRPVGAIEAAVTAGDCDVPVLSDDEIGTLAVALNTRRRESIEARTRLEAAVRDVDEARKQAENANRAKSNFLANMSHEIRTPMGAILGYSELIAESSSRPQQVDECVRAIRRNAEHLLSIINEILDLSKIEAGKMTVERQETHPLQILNDVQSMMAPRCEQKGLRFAASIDTPIPETIITDSVRFRQILTNLVSNAVKFTDHGEIQVRASFSSSPDGGGVLMVRVRDTGIGIGADKMAELFKPFSQVDASATRRFGGTGLGLCISRSFAKLLGGDISVTSETGRGSEFTVSISTGTGEGTNRVSAGPLDDQARVTGAGPCPIERSQAGLGGVRIFFVEDGPDNRRLIEHHLRKAGADVRVFENGLEALCAMTQDHTPQGPLISPPVCDVVLTDMQMPVMDGYTLASTLRAKGWTAPIVALTAHAMVGDEARCRAAGCDRYATKPVNRDQLISVCRISNETRLAA